MSHYFDHKTGIRHERQDDLAARLTKIAMVLSVVIILAVAAMQYITQKLELNLDFSFLPPVYSAMNFLAGCCLLLSLYYIRIKNISMHQRMNYVAFALSSLFLLLYVAYHITTPSTKYCGDYRLVYFLLLITHIVLATVSFPFILLTFIRGFTFQVDKHRKMARWVYWVWLYVAFSGPICYLMLMPCY